jgi:hypothetical protein
MSERKTNHGIPMTEEELAEWQQAFIDIEESIRLVYKKGKDC